MTFATLFKSGYRAFIEEDRDRGDLWFFLHIPKTAGSSFRAELQSLLTPDHNIHAYDGEAEGEFTDRLGAAIRAFAASTWKTPYRFVSGHVPVDMMEPIRNAARTPKTFTMLRDPVGRVISDFRYQSTPQHPDYAVFRARYPSIEAYLDAPGEGDKMMRYLRPHAAADVAETIAHVLETFVFVGSMETYDTSFAVMMELLGANRAPSVFLRKTEDRQATDVRLTPELESRIRAANARDLALYDGLMAYVRQVDALRRDAPSAGTARAPDSGFSAWRDL